MKRLWTSLRACAFAALLVPGLALAWGERGHHIVGSMAARAVVDAAPESPLSVGLSKFYADRTLILGHVSNLPDTSWKDSETKKRVSRMNSPNHYFGPERLLGPPASYAGEEFAAYLERVRALPADYAALKQRYDGGENALPGAPAYKKQLKLYEDLGVTPWRSQELYTLLVEAFRCAKGKEGRTDPPASGAYSRVEPPFRGEAELPSYVCDAAKSRRSDLHAVVLLSGVLSHFIGDQGQPYHPTADHDGWVTGNGGIHTYYESKVVQSMDERLAPDALELARDAGFRERTWARIGTDLHAANGVTQLLLNMAADTQSHLAELREIDDRVAIIKKSAVLPWGDHPSYHKPGEVAYAERFPADKPEVLAAFRAITVERLATSIVALSKTWAAAWEEAGMPTLSDQNQVSLPYPLDSEFVWPGFDPDALDRSRDSSRDPKYPAAWWAPVPRGEAAPWEILPQDAGAGEVILSKRTELGILSNFAATPIEVRGVRYASVEGFWQMMKFPEGPDDPRAKAPGVSWPHTRAEVARMTAFEAKRAGDVGSENMKKMGINWVTFEGKRLEYRTSRKGEHYGLILEAMAAKVAQNPEVRRILLATGDLVLKPDHHQGPETPPAWRYYLIWMEIRAKVAGNGHPASESGSVPEAVTAGL